MMLRRCRTLALSSTALVVWALALPPGTQAAAPPGAATPQALVERMTAAGKTKNMGEIIACLDPASRSEMSMGLLMATTFMVAFMGAGADMAGSMAEGMATAADKAKAEKGKAEAAKKVAAVKTDYAALLKRNGLPNLLDDKAPMPKDKAAMEAMMAKVDHAALATDLMAFMDRVGDKKDASESPAAGMPVPKDVTDYKIDGDHATAKAAGETLDFVKIDGRWFFKPPQKSAEK